MGINPHSTISVVLEESRSAYPELVNCGNFIAPEEYEAIFSPGAIV